MSHVTIIQGHPDPAGGHLCHALADAYAEGARAAGHTVARIEVANIQFPLLRTQAEFESGAVPETLRIAAAELLAAQHIVIIFPLWLGTMPALLKGFLEQVMRPGVAFAYRKNGLPEKRLAGRSARLVVTMGMPAMIYRWYFFAHGLRGLERSILSFAGIGPIHESLYGMVQTASEEKRRRWLEQMRKYGRALT